MESERYATEADMLALLCQAYQQGDEEELMRVLRQWITDPVQPVSNTGRFRLHPLLFVLILAVLAVIAALVYLSHMQL